MKIQINGETRELIAPLTLSSLIEQLGMKQDRVAVELNRQITPREAWPLTSLAEGDRLEIVHFVGGGLEFGVGVAERSETKTLLTPPSLGYLLSTCLLGARLRQCWRPLPGWRAVEFYY